MAMKIILLGTGTSTGVPEVGCGCLTCQSLNPRDKRLRSSALLVSSTGKRILIDCGPDFRAQARRVGLDCIDAIVVTHEHYDHVYGLDDLRTIAYNREIPIYGQSHVLEAIRRRLHYVFRDNPYPGTPKLRLQELREDTPLYIDNLTIQPILVKHGTLPIYGYRFTEHDRSEEQGICYITDMKSVSPEEWQKVNGTDLLIINALRYKKPHPSHQSVLDVEIALSDLDQKPKLSVLTHLSHHAPQHELLERLLPKGLCVGYDFMTLTIKEDGQITSKEFPILSPPYELIDVDEFFVPDNKGVFGLLDLSTQPALRDRALRSDVSYLLLQTNDRTLVAHFLLSSSLYKDMACEVLSAMTEATEALLHLYAADSSVTQIQKHESLTLHSHCYTIQVAVNGDHSLQSITRSPESLDVIVVKAQFSAQIHQSFMRFMDNPLQNL